MSGAPAGGRRRQRGIALAATVFALVALAALLAGLWFAACQESRVGANVVAERQAFDAAEAGLDAALAGWDVGALDRLPVNDTVGFAGSLAGGGATYLGTVRRLGPWLFLVSSTGSDRRGSSRRTLAAVAHLSPLRLGVEAALVASGPVRLGAGALVDALAPDTGRGCEGMARGAIGVVLGAAADLQMSSCPGGSCLRGNPAASVDSTLRGEPVPLLGEAGWATLVAAAETIRAGRAAPPAAPAWVAPGDFELAAGAPSGPGILLVQGDLLLQDGAQFTGLVVVRGKLVMRGGGGTIRGAAIVGGADLAAPAGARASLVHSACVVAQVLAAAAPARRLRERSWTAVYQGAL